jgi:hypothetical protein
MVGAVLILSIAAILCVITLAVVLYHQFLMTNEINKRLVLIARESIERERITMEEHQNTLIQLAIATEAGASQESTTTPVASTEEEDINFFSDINY